MLQRRAIHHFSLVCLLTAAGGVDTALAQQPPETRLRIYGQLRQDFIFDDARPDAAQTPLFILPEPATTTAAGSFTMHPRLTRFGVAFMGPTLQPMGNGAVSGRLEVDFQNGGRESRALPRFRHAYLQLDWSSHTLLIGQTWDLISPLFPSVNADTLMWNAGNLGDRRPQVRYTFQSKSDGWQWSLAAGAGLTGAIDAQDLDNDGVRDGEAAGCPTLQSRASLSYPIAGLRRATIGVYGHLSELKLSAPVADVRAFASRALGIDFEVALPARLVVRGEGWTGRNLADIRGGIGQAINRATGSVISSRGGWIEAGSEVTPRHAIFVGYTVDAPDRDELPPDGRTRNGAWFLVNRWNAGPPFTVGVDYLRWTTKYMDRPTGTDNRMNVYAIYSF
jgi:hypothetical protein